MNARLLTLGLCVSAAAGCGRFGSQPATTQSERIVCIAQVYAEMIYALGAQDRLVAVDYSSTFPPEIKELPTVGYHRALSAEGILSMRPTVVLHDGNIGPPQVIEQLEQLNVPMKTFEAQPDSVEGTKQLLREMGAYFHKEARAEELCVTLDREMAAALEQATQYQDHPRVAVIHFGRASNIYMVVGAGGRGDGAAAGRMVEWAGGRMAIDRPGMQRMASPEVIAQANPEIILMTEYGYDRLGSNEQVAMLPGVAQTDAARNGRIYRVPEHELMYFGPQTGENIGKLAHLIHGR
ncbi:MAG: ABC transporter substrate-binding protein [Acidobacteria bacterium]|nr:ABC transporter substrate-binding protein [Acidobacteriota bacterium]